MNRMLFTRVESFPGFAFSLHGGAMSWQEWMTDFLIATSTSFDGSQVAVISFTSGQPLLRAQLPAEAAGLLRSGVGYALLSEDFSAEARLESLLWKPEPYDFTGLFWTGIQHQMQGEYQKAVDAYLQVIQANPLIPRVHNLLGLSLRQLQRMDEAEQAYQKEVEISPDSPDAYANLGVLYSKTGRTPQARQLFERSLDRDQFYLNALLQLSRILQEGGEATARLIKALHLRLLAGHGDQPAVQDALQKAATSAGQQLTEYVSALQSTLDLNVLRFIKRLETLRQNGAVMALLGGYTHLLERTPAQPAAAAFIHSWVKQRLELVQAKVPPFLQTLWQAQIQTLYQRWPGLLGRQTEPSPIAFEERTGALTAEEFYELLLAEIILDGQVQPEEVRLVSRLKNTLKISQATHDELWARVLKHRQANLQADDGRAFDRRQFLQRLWRAIRRDGLVDESEKVFLRQAAESLELTKTELQQFLSEVRA